jgi:6-phosphogluconolactonase
MKYQQQMTALSLDLCRKNVLDEREFETIESAAWQVAEELASVLQLAIATRGRAVIAVSGGQTPLLVYAHLSRSVVDWSRVTVTLTDERWVPPSHSQSNEWLVLSYLTVDPNIAYSFVPLFGGEDTPEAGHKACESRLESLVMPFDAVYLGMGSDRHIASLFPDEATIDCRDQLCVPVPSSGSRVSRMSLTVSTLLRSRQLFLLYSGADKHSAYTRAKIPGDVHDVPLRAILEQDKVPVTVFRAH